MDPTQLAYEGIVLNSEDFEPWTDNGSDVPAGENARIATVEIGEQGQLSAFEALRLGDSLDPSDPAKGRLFMNPVASDGSEVSDNAQIRFRMRDQNGNKYEPATPWYTVRDLNRDRPDHRRALRPRTKDGGKPWYWKRGREVVIEGKDEGSTFNMDIEQSLVEAPARGGL